MGCYIAQNYVEVLFLRDGLFDLLYRRYLKEGKKQVGFVMVINVVAVIPNAWFTTG